MNQPFFSFHFGDDTLVAIAPKKDLTFMGTSYWKTLKTVENIFIVREIANCEKRVE